jgi:phosphoribosylamine---glycine ligase
MKLLMVGGGGREHALLSKLQRDDSALELLAAPGNPGIASIARCIPIQPTDIDALARLAAREAVDLTVVGPEAPLAAGIVDRFVAEGRAIFGPTRAAAAIETSKAFTKALMLRAGIPTALASRHVDPDDAKAAARRLGAPVVIKASGLAAGKGVTVCGSMEEADDAIDAMLRDGRLGQAGAEVLVEEYMEGEELSLFAITDGWSVLPMLPAQDHKRLLDGDRGPNTGGMGAYAPVSISSPELLAEVERTILLPTLEAFREHGAPFSGLLYAGLMLTSEGPKVVEFNCRFGDPETQAILPLLRNNLLESLAAVATRAGISTLSPFEWSADASVTTVVAAPGYPDAPTTGAAIELPAPRPGVEVFHAGTRRDDAGVLRTAGGRVLAVTAVAPTMEAARTASLDVARQVRFPGAQFRTDIAWREVSRIAGAS